MYNVHCTHYNNALIFTKKIMYTIIVIMKIYFKIISDVLFSVEFM